MRGCCARAGDLEEDAATYFDGDGTVKEDKSREKTSQNGHTHGGLILDTSANGSMGPGSYTNFPYVTSPIAMSPTVPLPGGISPFSPSGIASPGLSYASTVSAASLVRSDTAHGHGAGVVTADTTTAGRTSMSTDAYNPQQPSGPSMMPGTPTAPPGSPSLDPAVQDILNGPERARLAIIVRNMMRMRALAKAIQGGGNDTLNGAGTSTGEGTSGENKHPVVGVSIGTSPPVRKRTASSSGLVRSVSPDRGGLSSPISTSGGGIGSMGTISLGSGGVETMRQSRVSKLIPELKSLEPVHLFTPHAALVRNMQFSPCGRYLATCR